jgi:UDP-glucose 4-epimerase
MTILVTGGAGYIGSHTCVELLQAGHDIVVIDNLVNSSAVALDRARAIAGRGRLSFHRVDLCDPIAVDHVFTDEQPEAVIHFAGLKSVGESVRMPLHYYGNNVSGTLVLLEVMRRHACRSLVFSSSATVYGDPQHVPIHEGAPLSATNPYGRTKLYIEEILRDLARSEPGWRIIPLRYFNPVGAHPSGLIGEDPAGIPNNLMPFALQVAAGRRPELAVFGGDWPTPDGTGVRDYIHVVDLAQGHLAALAKLPQVDGCVPVNLGTGRGSSVLEVVAALATVAGRPVAHRIVARRPGDVASSYANPTFAASFLGWHARLDLAAMCREGWNWQQRNPDGYRS